MEAKDTAKLTLSSITETEIGEWWPEESGEHWGRVASLTRPCSLSEIKTEKVKPDDVKKTQDADPENMDIAHPASPKEKKKKVNFVKTDTFAREIHNSKSYASLVKAFGSDQKKQIVKDLVKVLSPDQNKQIAKAKPTEIVPEIDQVKETTPEIPPKHTDPRRARQVEIEKLYERNRKPLTSPEYKEILRREEVESGEAEMEELGVSPPGAQRVE